MRQALLEWHEVKVLPNSTTTETPHPHEQEQLGCWSTRHESERIPMRVLSMLNHLRFDISCTRIPGETRNVVWSKNDDFVDFGHIVPYIFPGKPLRHPSGSYGIMHDSPMGHRLDPDEQMSCFDFLYYATSSHETFEWKFPWSPAWRRVATHMHFTDELVDTVKGYLSRMFKSSEDDIPPVSVLPLITLRDSYFTLFSSSRCTSGEETLGTNVQAVLVIFPSRNTKALWRISENRFGESRI